LHLKKSKKSFFEIYSDASSLQLGAVITQRGRPLAFFSRKLSDTQRKYSVTELELLSIVECLKEFRGMLWGQRIKVYTDHKNLVRDALGLTSDRVYRWRLLLEEYGPEIEYIKGTDNTVADAISRLEYGPTRHKRDNNALQCFSLVKLFNTCHVHHGGAHASRTTFNTDNIQNVEERICFAQIFSNTTGEEEEIYPVTVQEIATAQRKDETLKSIFKRKAKAPSKISLKVIDDVEILVYNENKLVIPSKLQSNIIQWYHHYLQHPGHTRLEETLSAALYWPGMRKQVRAHAKRCHRCQAGKSCRRKYGEVPPKIA
jgi:hypothetical protein